MRRSAACCPLLSAACCARGRSSQRASSGWASQDCPQREPRPEYAPRRGKEHERAGQHGGKIQTQRAQIVLLGLGGGGPLQQSFMADAHTPQHAQDCIQPGDGIMGSKSSAPSSAGARSGSSAG